MIDNYKGFGLAKTIAVVCAQFGDTGKGKMVDVFAEQADIIVRGTGGDNAGHTIKTDDAEYIFHLIPSGICYDGAGKINIIGNGTVIYPKTLCDELELLGQKKMSYEHLFIALNAHLILPQHIVLDRLKECQAGQTKIGTTGKGIGPTYVDHVNRCGLIMNDLLNKDTFVKKFRHNLSAKQAIFQQYPAEVIEKIMHHEHLENGCYYHGQDVFNEEAVIAKYMAYGKVLSDMISDADAYVRISVSKKNILLEGAQGLLLSIDYGTYPYVTSSDPSVYGLAKGSGLSVSEIDLTFGIIKGFYMTRVGRGPFPTEMGGQQSDEWCNDNPQARAEENILLDMSVNHHEEFYQGMAIRQVGNEYGATTGRPRRIGWLDLVLLRHALKYLPSKNLILTKLDVLNDCEIIKICDYYSYNGRPIRLGKSYLPTGSMISNLAIIPAEILEHCRPNYKTFPGWQEDLNSCQSFADLPTKLKDILDYITDNTGANHRIISIGPKREQTIFI